MKIVYFDLSSIHDEVVIMCPIGDILVLKR